MRTALLSFAALLPAAAVPLLAASAGAARPPILPFIEDDAPRAEALARSKKLPIFVEAWAPW
jgi:hypothetical protein